MAVAHDTAVESHTASTGSASEASFDISITPASGVKGLLVFTFVNANADNATSVKIDPAGANIDVPAVTGGRAVDTATEPGDCKAWFLGAGLPAGGSAWTVRVNRTNNANVMYAVAITVTAAGDTEVFDVILQQENGAVAEEYVNSGCPTNAVRYAGVNSGLATHPAAGANSTELHFFPATAGTRSITVVRETTAGVGARLVGCTGAADDRAYVLLAVREKVYDRADIVCDIAVVGDTGHADATVLTTAIIKGMMIGANPTPTFDTSATGQTIHADVAARPRGYAVNVRSAGIISHDCAHRSYRLDNSLTSRGVVLDIDSIGAAVRAMTVFGVLKTSIPNEGVNSELYDIVRINTVSGHFVILQLDSGQGQANGGYAFNLETDTGGATTHSSYVTVTPDNPYWFNLKSNVTSGVPEMAIWDLLTGKLVASITSTQHATQEDIVGLEYGNFEIGQASAFTFLQLYADYTAATFPVAPPFGGIPDFGAQSGPRFFKPRRRVI
jgi:hypothetical protein